MNGWKEYKLKDLCSRITDGSHKSPKAQATGFPMFSVKDMEEYGFSYNDCKLISAKDFAEMKSTGCVPEKDDILIAKDGSYLKQIFICKENREEAILSSIAIFRPNKDIIEPRFLMYLLKSPQVFNYIKKNCVSGSAIPRIVLKAFRNVVMEIPESIVEQRRISDPLTEIDSKIECNRKICSNLEMQAESIFKYWFIDFAPFKDGKFVESELGMIPEGWRVGKLEEIVDLIKPSIKPQDNVEYSHYSIPAFDNNQIPSCDLGESIKSNKFAIQDGATLFSKLNPEHKRIWFVNKVEKNAICSTEFLPFYAKHREQSAFVYCYLNNRHIYREIANGAKGTTNSHQRIDADAILARTIAYDNEAISSFCDIVGDLLKKMYHANQECSRLATLRDTLLPRLMSGQIKL